MSSQLDDRIRTMMQTVVDESPPPPEIPVRPPAPVAPRRIPNWAAAVGAAVAVLVLIGGVTLLLDGSSTDDVIEEPMPTVATTTPTTVPDTTPTIAPDVTPSTVPGTTIPAAPIPDLSGSGMLAINQVRDLALAPDAAIWGATGGGVVRWDAGASIPVVYGEQDGLPAAGVYQIVVAADGTVWATGDGWLAYYDGTWNPVEAHAEMWVQGMAADTMGGVWLIGRYDNRVLHINRDGIEQISLPESWDSFDDIAVDTAGRLWMVSGDGDDGVVVYDGSSWREYTTADGLPGHVMSDVDVAPDGTVWIATHAVDKGQLDPGEDPSVLAAGVASFDGETWTTYTTADGLASNEGEIAIAPDGTVWVIHPDPTSPWGAVSAASRRDGDTWTVFDVAGSRWSGAVGGSDGTLWLGTSNGVVHFDGASTTRHVVPDEMAPAVIPLTLEPTTSAAISVDAGPFGEVTWQTFDVLAGHGLGVGIATPHGFVANSDVSLMTSPDGVKWTAVEPPLNAGILAASGEDLYAGAVRFAWTGTTWRAASVLEINGPESDSRIAQMAFGDGITVMTNESQIFFSTDGNTFDPAIQGPDPKSNLHEPGIGPLLATGSGFIVFDSEFVSCQPVIWVSSDGSTWESVSAEFPSGSTACITDVAEHDGRMVAVGEHGRSSQGGLWVSDDGLTWNEIPPESINGSITSVPWAIAAGEAGWVALFGDAGIDGGVWAMYSLDGLEWVVVADAFPDLYWAYGTPGVAVGTDRLLMDYDGVVHIGEINR